MTISGRDQQDLVDKGNSGFSLNYLPRKLPGIERTFYWVLRQSYWDKERGGGRARYVGYIGLTKQLKRTKFLSMKSAHPQLTEDILQRLGVEIVDSDERS